MGDVTALDEDCTHSIALKSDGTVVARGDNIVHQTDVPTSLCGVLPLSPAATAA